MLALLLICATLGPSPVTAQEAPSRQTLTTVPNVVGQTVRSAAVQMLRAGMGVVSVDSLPNRAPPGTIVRQRPAAGTLVPRGTAVLLTVANRPSGAGDEFAPTPPARERFVLMPNYVDSMVGAAIIQLRERSFSIGNVTPTFTNRSRPGVVVDHTPRPGTPVVRGARVDLVVAAPQPVTVPDVVDTEIRAADAMLRQHTLTPGQVTRRATCAARPGTVLVQSPPAGQRVAQQSSVDLVVAAPGSTGVPGLGPMLADARDQLRHADLVVGTLSRRRTERVPTGTVMAQSPTAGTMVGCGTAVDLVVAMAPPPVRVPDVVGMRLNGASIAIDSARLVVGTVEESSRIGGDGAVVDQEPGAGAVVPIGTPVSLTISTPVTARVPHLVGSSVDDVPSLLGGPGLGLRSVSQVPDDAPGGTVLRQSPRANTVVTLPAGVDVIVAQGSGGVDSDTTVLVPVPRFVGLTRAEANDVAATSLVLVFVEPSSGDGDGALVATQEPAPDSLVPAGSTVRVTLRSAPATPLPGTTFDPTFGPTIGTTVDVPDLDRMTASGADSTLAAAGLLLGASGGPPPGPDDVVVDQFPEPGTPVPPGSSVAVELRPPPAAPEPFASWPILAAVVAAGLAGLGLRTLRGRRVSPPQTPQPRPAPAAATPTLRPGRDAGVQTVRLTGTLLRGPVLRLRPRSDAGVQRARCDGSLLLTDDSPLPTEEVHDA